MIIAKFFRGPADGEILQLPTEEPWAKFVIAQFEPITVEFFYLLAGKFEEGWAYLYEEDVLSHKE